MDDSGSFAGDNVGIPLRVAAAVDDPVAIYARFSGQLRIVRNAAVGVLRRQVVEGTGVGPPDQVFSLDRLERLEAPLLLEDLGDRFELGTFLSANPIPADRIPL